MKKNKKAFCVWMIETTMTVATILFASMDVGWQRLLPVAWAFFSWNFLAYAIDRDMWPWIFVELEGKRKGYPPAREAMFWVTAFLYVGILVAIWL